MLSEFTRYAEEETDLFAGMRINAQFGSYASMCASERHDEEALADYEEGQRTGYAVCPECGERKVKVRSFFARQYGGGYDTTYVCESDGCSYKEVCV